MRIKQGGDLVVRCSDVPVGKVFNYEGVTYIKAINGYSFNLSTNDTVHIDSSRLVTYFPDATLYLNDIRMLEGATETEKVKRG